MTATRTARAGRAAVSLISCVSYLAAPARGLAEPAHHNAVYIELLGKGGLWGVGYDRRFAPRFSAGAVGSFYILGGERVGSVSPYAGLVIAGSRRNSWFVHAGPQIAHVWSPSPVPEWDGTSSTGIGGEVSSGYEHRDRVLVRVFAQGVAGKGGVQPWLGASFGWEF